MDGPSLEARIHVVARASAFASVLTLMYGGISLSLGSENHRNQVKFPLVGLPDQFICLGDVWIFTGLGLVLHARTYLELNLLHDGPRTCSIQYIVWAQLQWISLCLAASNVTDQAWNPTSYEGLRTRIHPEHLRAHCGARSG